MHMHNFPSISQWYTTWGWSTITPPPIKYIEMWFQPDKTGIRLKGLNKRYFRKHMENNFPQRTSGSGWWTQEFYSGGCVLGRRRKKGGKKKTRNEKWVAERSRAPSVFLKSPPSRPCCGECATLRPRTLCKDVILQVQTQLPPLDP